MGNLDLYEKVRTVPNSAQRKIEAGRLKGKTDINPMWRIKTLTEQFGPCGKGWYYKITDKRLETSGESGEMAAFVDIELYVKFGEEWSAPIIGTGGSMFLTEERNGLHVSDECFKMALTDAISVACKALGIGADVYWEKDVSKYTQNFNTDNEKKSVKAAEIRRSAPPDEEAPPEEDMPPEEEAAPVRRLPSDVLKIPGADKADNKTLFVNALNIGKIELQKGRDLIDNMFGENVRVNSLTRKDFESVLTELDKMVK